MGVEGNKERGGADGDEVVFRRGRARTSRADDVLVALSRIIFRSKAVQELKR